MGALPTQEAIVFRTEKRVCSPSARIAHKNFRIRSNNNNSCDSDKMIDDENKLFPKSIIQMENQLERKQTKALQVPITYNDLSNITQGWFSRRVIQKMIVLVVMILQNYG